MTTSTVTCDRCSVPITVGRTKLVCEGGKAPPLPVCPSSGRPSIDLCPDCLGRFGAWLAELKTT